MMHYLYAFVLRRRNIWANQRMTREARRAMQPVAVRGRQRHQRKEEV